LVNLLGNAIKFTAKGEIIVLLEKESETESGVVVHFSVRDTGAGIATENQSAIFGAFTQADNSITRKHGGTGLGLTICKRLIEMMGGRIWIESELGRGSTFHFTAQFGVRQVVPAKAQSLEMSMLQGLPVWVVDDNATNRLILKENLTAWGMNPRVFENGEAVLTALQEFQSPEQYAPSIILDVQMPDMDGFTVVEKMRQLPNFIMPKIIMMASAGIRGDAARCRELGIASYLSKPVAKLDLLDAIKKILEYVEDEERTPALVTRYSIHESRACLTILIAEDNRINQLMVVRLLEKRGHTVVVAETGRAALIASEKQCFDVILMDMQMPEMDGLEATVLIRKREKVTGKHVPIYAMTANAMASDKEKCLLAGMDGYLSKPINNEELFAILGAIKPSALVPQPA
jgi:two-component system sensor histidine kinase/response regulator